MFESVVEVPMIQDIDPGCDRLHIQAITHLADSSSCRWKCPDAGIPKARLLYNGSKLGFPM